MIEQGKPVYTLFQTSNHEFYIFDTYANKIQKISNVCFTYLKKLNEHKTDFFQQAASIDNDEFQQFYRLSREQGFFSNMYIEKLQHPMTEMLEDILDDNIESMNLQVTQNCNLRCDYCPYTGNYYNNRKHANKRMDFELAKKGIQFLYHHSSNCDVINVSFYGGEPLLEFDLIKKCTQYTKEIFGSRKVIFSLTTNAVLLSDEIMRFFCENNVLLTISLDGPENIHDKSRVFADGKGSFAAVYRNLCQFKQQYTEYFNQNVMFNTVCAQDLGVMDVDHFFSNDPLFEKCEVITTFYSTNYIRNEPQYKNDMDQFIQYLEFEKYKCFLYMMKRIKTFPSRMQLNRFEEMKKTYKTMKTFTGIPACYQPLGQCVPGRKKLFLNVEGNFFPCERIDETSPCSVIGNIEDGLSLEKCEKLLNIGKITEEKCKNCWMIAHCKFCFIQADNGGELSAACRLEKCSDLQASMLDTLKDICILEKYGYHFEEEA